MGALTMATILEQIERDLLRRAKGEGAAYAKAQKARLEQELLALREQTNAKKAAADDEQREAALAQADKDVKTASAAAVKEALARLQIRERMAHSGHKGGGLQSAAFRGASQARQKNRVQMLKARREALDAINGKAAALYRELEAAYAQKADTLMRQTAQKIEDKQASLDADARKQAKQIARSAKGYAQWQEGLY